MALLVWGSGWVVGTPFCYHMLTSHNYPRMRSGALTLFRSAMTALFWPIPTAIHWLQILAGDR